MHRAARLLLASALPALLLSACMMAPVRPDMPHLNDDISARSTRPDEVRLVFYNNSNKLTHGLDNTGRINVWLDGKAVGGPDIGEFVQVQVPRKPYRVRLVHLDMTEMSSEHQLDATADPTYVEVRATITSNELKAHQALPAGNALPQPMTRFVQKQ